MRYLCGLWGCWDPMLQVSPASVSSPQQDTQPGKQAPRVWCNLTFIVGLSPLTLGLPREGPAAHARGLEHTQTRTWAEPAQAGVALGPLWTWLPYLRLLTLGPFQATAPSVVPCFHRHLSSTLCLHGAELLAESHRHHGSLTSVPCSGCFLSKSPCKGPFSIAGWSKIA